MISCVKHLQKKYDLVSLNSDHLSVELPMVPYYIHKLLHSDKGSKLFYITLLPSKFKKSASNLKWETILESNIDESDWRTYNIIPFRCTQSTELRWLQIKIINNILGTNYYLHKIKASDTPLCSYCKTSNETVFHLFWDCNLINRLWKKIEEWLMLDAGIRVELNPQTILFGLKENRNDPLNIILLLIKQTIFRNRKYGIIPDQNYIFRICCQYYYVSKCIAFTTCSYDQFTKFWSSLHTLFA